MNRQKKGTLFRLLVAYGLAAITWRVLGFVWLRRSPLLGSDPGPQEVGLLMANGLMGLGFITLGLLALTRVRSPASQIFALSAISAGIYFGGPLPATYEISQEAIWLGYLAVGAVLSSSALLHFVLSYPEPVGAIRLPGCAALLYIPFSITLILAGWILFEPLESDLRGSLREWFLALQSTLTLVFVVVALVCVPIRYVRCPPPLRRPLGLDMMTLGTIAGTLPLLAATAAEHLAPRLTAKVGVVPGFLELLVVLIPMGFCSALLHSVEPNLPPSQTEA